MSLTLVYLLNPAHISASAPPLFIFYLHSLGLTCFLLGPRLRQPCFLKASWKVAESSCRLRRGTFSIEMGGRVMRNHQIPEEVSISYDFSIPGGMSMIFHLILWCPCILAIPILTPPLLSCTCKYFFLMDIYSLCLQFLRFRIFHLSVFNVQNTNTSLKTRGSSSRNKHPKDHQFVYAKLHSIFSMCKIDTFMRGKTVSNKMGV